MSRYALILSVSILFLATVVMQAQAPKPGGGAPGSGAGGPAPGSGAGKPAPGSGAGGPSRPGNPPAGPATNPPSNPLLPGAGGSGGKPALPGTGVPGLPSGGGNPSAPSMPRSPGLESNEPVSSFLNHDLDYWIRRLDPNVNRDAAVRELAIRVIPMFGT